MLKIYIAGPDVFLDDAIGVLTKKAEIIKLNNFIALSPFDNESSNPSEIVKLNEDHIKNCDVIIANLIPFRGTEPDAGTVYEIGYGKALGKKVLAYNVPKKEYKYQVASNQYLVKDALHCVQGWKMEDFSKRLNIMLAENIEIYSSFEECILSLCKEQ